MVFSETSLSRLELCRAFSFYLNCQGEHQDYGQHKRSEVDAQEDVGAYDHFSCEKPRCYDAEIIAAE